MSIRERYLAYAQAFEKSFVDDDWSRIGPFFTEDAVYEGDPEARGREQVLAKLKSSVDQFDRRMDSRTLDFEPPTVDGDTLSVRWTATYTKKGCPDLVLEGVERAVFEGEQIATLRDTFEPGVEQTMQRWIAEHGAKLQD